MNITLYDLDNIKNACDNLSTLVTEIKKAYNPQNVERQMFVSRADYEESLKLKNKIPQDFYYFRCFDVLIQIVFNKRTSMYQIYIDGFYSDILNKYKRVQRSNKSYEIGTDFDKVLLVWQDLITDCIKSKVLQNGLF